MKSYGYHYAYFSFTMTKQTGLRAALRAPLGPALPCLGVRAHSTTLLCAAFEQDEMLSPFSLPLPCPSQASRRDPSEQGKLLTGASE